MTAFAHHADAYLGIGVTGRPGRGPRVEQPVPPHELTGGKEGARVLDVFTFFDPAGRSVEMDFRDKAVEGERGVFEAARK
jgi:hypothetical protein